MSGDREPVRKEDGMTAATNTTAKAQRGSRVGATRARLQRTKGAEGAAKWLALVPEATQEPQGLTLESVFATHGWGSAEREVLPVRAVSSQMLEVPTGAGFNEFVKNVVHDLVMCSRAQGTWKAYKA